MANTTDSWERIRTWILSNVEDDTNGFEKPATKGELDDLEDQLELVLPDVVRETLHFSNGSGDRSVFPYGDYLCSCKQIIEEWDFRLSMRTRSILSDAPIAQLGVIKDVWWSDQWIPIISNGCGDCNVIDTDPAKGGIRGQFFEFSHEEGPYRLISNSLEEYLAGYASSLEAGEYRYDVDERSILPAIEVT